MKSEASPTFIYVALILVVLLVSSCSQAPQPQDVTSDISLANKTFMEAFSQGNAKAVASAYTANAKLLPANTQEVEGQASIEAFWSAVMGMGIKKVELETVSAEAFGDAAVEEGHYKLFAAGDQLADQGKYIVTWKKEAGTWKLHRDIWTTNNPSSPTRAMEGDSVWVINNRIKADKLKQFEDFNFNILAPAAAEFYPKMKNTVRTLKSVAKNKDGSLSYFYLMDAATSPDGYEMLLPLKAKYGEKKAAEYLKTFEDCLKGGEQEGFVTIQTKW